MRQGPRAFGWDESCPHYLSELRVSGPMVSCAKALTAYWLTIPMSSVFPGYSGGNRLVSLAIQQVEVSNAISRFKLPLSLTTQPPSLTTRSAASRGARLAPSPILTAASSKLSGRGQDLRTDEWTDPFLPTYTFAARLPRKLPADAHQLPLSPPRTSGLPSGISPGSFPLPLSR